ncbi:MAG: HEAT repeat domain-containing protein, partial [bacterium]|nr:HEAT repeat domain-containing protein [bacterium]
LSVASYQAVLGAGEACRKELREKVRSRDRAVFEASAAALANLNERRAVPDLVAALEERGERALPAAWALGIIGDPAAIPPLAASLASPNHDLRKTAVRALVRMGSPVEGEVIRVWRENPAAAERAAIRVLGEIRSPRAVSPLLAAKPENRDAAVWALGRIRNKAAAASVREAMDDPRWQVRREAAQALGYLGDRTDAALLRRALSDRETVVREWAARSLTALTGEDVLFRDEDGKMVPPYNLYH